MVESIKIFLPEIFLSSAALAVLTIDSFLPKIRRIYLSGISLFALATAFFWVLEFTFFGRGFGMVVTDDFSTFFKLLAILGSALVVLISQGDEDLLGKNAGAYLSLIIFSTVGIMFLSSAEDLFILFIGLELTTLPLFVLAGFLRNQLRSSEGAIKFFLMGAFSTGLMLFGISYIYGLCGSTHFHDIRNFFLAEPVGDSRALFIFALLMMLVGLGFKLSLVPFHQWAPDTYEGSPTPIAAFLSVAREGGGIVVMLRFFSEFVNVSESGMSFFFAALSVLTMTIGNLSALRQENLKRLLAYSSIAHAGTIFVGLAAGNQTGREGAMIYSLAYFLMSLGAFAVVIAVSKIKKSEELSAMQGLARENLFLAILMIFFLMSLVGIPPLLGFWGKFYVFAACVESKMYGLVLIGLINSVISVTYYFRIAHNMFFKDSIASLPPVPSNFAPLGVQAATLFTAFAILFLGIFPQQILFWTKMKAHLLP